MLNRRRFLQSSSLLLAGAGLHVHAATTPLRLAYFETYSPLSFRGDQGMQGILIDLFDEILGKRLGIPLVHSGYPWVRAQSLVQSGEQDGMCTVATPERLDYTIASTEPVLTMPIRLFAAADSPLLPKLQAVRSLDELRQLKPTVLSYIGNGWARDKLDGLQVDWGGNFQEAVRKLVLGRGDVIVENAITMQYTLKQQDPQRKIRMLPNTLEESRFSLLISRRATQQSLLPTFDEALRKFKREEGYARVFERYGVRLT
ncbi:substrate-binding periplasmic protein [Chitinimonas naiadis]